MPTEPIVYISLEMWRQDAEERFGDDPLNWKFRCPCCGNIQTIRDFMNLGVDKNIAREAVYQECIGRYCNGRSAFGETKGKPCNYAAYGLIDLCDSTILGDCGEKIRVFSFAGFR